MKTVKAGETAYDCKQLADELKASVSSGDESKAMENLGKLGTELDVSSTSEDIRGQNDLR